MAHGWVTRGNTAKDGCLDGGSHSGLLCIANDGLGVLEAK